MVYYSLGIVDEYHAHKTNQMYKLLEGGIKKLNSEHFYVKFINWGTIYRPPQEFIYATGREADAELQKIAEQEYQSYLDNTLK